MRHRKSHNVGILAKYKEELQRLSRLVKDMDNKALLEERSIYFAQRPESWQIVSIHQCDCMGGVGLTLCHSTQCFDISRYWHDRRITIGSLLRLAGALCAFYCRPISRWRSCSVSLLLILNGKYDMISITLYLLKVIILMSITTKLILLDGSHWWSLFLQVYLFSCLYCRSLYWVGNRHMPLNFEDIEEEENDNTVYYDNGNFL